MNIDKIKEGETYNVRVKVIGKYGKCIDAIFADADDAIVGIHIPERRVGVLRPISPENGIKNTENAPKYDPNRMFRKGDKVKPRERNGRIPWAKDMTLTVVADERTAGVTVRDEETGEERLMCVLFLELVTPVEELEPYFVQDFKGGYGVFHTRLQPEAEVCHYFNDMHPHAKEAAEAERDRLNAELRKEQSNV